MFLERTYKTNLHTGLSTIPSHHDLTHPFRIKVLGAGIQKHAYNVNMITLHCGEQGCLVVLFWRAFRYAGDQKIVMVLTGTHRYNHETMTTNAVVDSHHPSQTHMSVSHTTCDSLIRTISAWFGFTLASVSKYSTTLRWPLQTAIQRGVRPFLMAYHLTNDETHTSRGGSQ